MSVYENVEVITVEDFNVMRDKIIAKRESELTNMTKKSSGSKGQELEMYVELIVDLCSRIDELQRLKIKVVD